MRSVFLRNAVKNIFVSISFAITCSVFSSSSTAFANTAKIISNVDIKPEATLSAQEEQGLSIAAGKLLNHVDHARNDLKAKNIVGAKRQIDKAITLGNIIKTTMPSYLVTTKLAAGQYKYEDQSKVQPLLVTLHEELNVETVMGPVRAAKREVAKKQAGETGQVVQEVRLHESRARLDVRLALSGLEQAKKYLSENRSSSADSALSTIQTGVVMEYVVADLPLERVQANLMLARQAIKDNKFDQARLALQIAQDSLQEYEKTVGSNRARESSELRAEIQALSTSMQQPNAKGSEEKLMNWWNIIAHWFKQ